MLLITKKLDGVWNSRRVGIYPINNIFMLRKLLLLAMLFTTATLFGQSEKRVDSKITEVTVFLDRAQVTRVVKTRVEAGKTNIILQGLTSSLDQQSVQVSGKGKFTILGISHQQNYSREFSSPRTKTLKDSIDLVQRSVTLEQAQKEILSKEEQLLLSNQKIGGANQNLSVAELKAMADFYRTRLNDIFAQRMKHDTRIKDLNEKLSKLQMQLREVEELHRKNTSEIIVQVSADGETNADLEVSYLVANAGWTPVYDIRALDTKSPIQLLYKANVFQRTGEEWRNVKLRLSTANPSLGGVKPQLTTWFVDIFNPVAVRSQNYKANKKVMATPTASAPMMEMEIAEDRAVAGSVADYVSTVETSLSTEFAISLPYTVLSASKPTLVDVATHSLKAEYIYSVAPKLDRDVFLMANITGWEEYSLLPGEANIFFEGTFVTKSIIDPNNIKDTLSISLGRDKRIVVDREKIKDYSSRKTIGSNQRDTYGYTITVRNNKAEPIRLIVEDQVPVSQNSQIEVSLLESSNASYDKQTGRLKWEMNLKPQESRKVDLKFEIKYPKDKNISGIY